MIHLIIKTAQRGAPSKSATFIEVSSVIGFYQQCYFNCLMHAVVNVKSCTHTQDVVTTTILLETKRSFGVHKTKRICTRTPQWISLCTSPKFSAHCLRQADYLGSLSSLILTTFSEKSLLLCSL